MVVMFSWVYSKMQMQCVIMYAVLTLVTLLFLQVAPVMSAPLPAPSPSKLTKKKSNLPPATDETIKVSKVGDSVYCINNSASSGSMTLEDLKKMINTVDQVFGSLATHETYLTTDYGASIFHSQDAIQAYYRLFDMLESSHSATPSNIWMSRSPCPLCAKRLIYEYSKPDSVKPTLKIASIYTGNNLLDTVDSLKCMARMVHLNFTVLPWDWTDTRNNADHADCIASIDSALQHTGFNNKREMLQSLINFIHKLSLDPEVNLWCSFSS